MRFRRVAASVGATVLVVAGFALAGASPASANQVWHQAIGRASADAACPTNTPEETAAGWTQWAGSWEKWMNGQTGGFVCQRDITWAFDNSSPINFCILAWPDTYWLDFAGTDWLPANEVPYINSACTERAPNDVTGAVSVLADTAPEAQVTCDAHGGGRATLYASEQAGADPRLYFCQIR
jgi:hypothetical protein